MLRISTSTFLTQGFAAAWELAGGTWVKPPVGKDVLVPLSARLLIQFEGIPLADDIQDINKYSNNVMARQLLLTLALEKMGKPATTANGDLVIQSWLKQNGLHFNGLVIENGSGLSRNEAISADTYYRLSLKVASASQKYDVNGTTKGTLSAQTLYASPSQVSGTGTIVAHGLVSDRSAKTPIGKRLAQFKLLVPIPGAPKGHAASA